MASEKQIGSFCWNEMLTSNLPKAKQFYSEVFGWTAVETEMGPPESRYVLFLKNGEHVAGLGSLEAGDLGTSRVNAASTWLSHVNVADLDATLELATERGAQLVSGPTDIPGLGRYAVLTDPNGARLAVYQAGASTT